MASINKALIIGYLGANPETKYAASGQQLCRFTVATSDKYTDKNGQQQEQTEWHRIVVWGKLAEICDKYLVKGSQVYVEGSIRNRKWDDNGITKYSTEINAREIKFLSRGQGDNGPEPGEIDDLPF